MKNTAEIRRDASGQTTRLAEILPNTGRKLGWVQSSGELNIKLCCCLKGPFLSSVYILPHWCSAVEVVPALGPSGPPQEWIQLSHLAAQFFLMKGSNKHHHKVGREEGEEQDQRGGRDAKGRAEGSKQRPSPFHGRELLGWLLCPWNCRPNRIFLQAKYQAIAALNTLIQFTG